MNIYTFKSLGMLGQMYHAGEEVEMNGTDFYRVEDVSRERIEQSSKLEQIQRRYTWAANELLACDYGDNDHPSKAVGWRVYGWRHRSGARRIYGDSIDMAIDIELEKPK